MDDLDYLTDSEKEIRILEAENKTLSTCVSGYNRTLDMIGEPNDKARKEMFDYLTKKKEKYIYRIKLNEKLIRILKLGGA